MRWLCLILVCATGAAASDGAGLSPSEFKKAAKLDRKKCYRCHKPHDPRDYSAEEWDGWMQKMARKARLKEKDEALLKRYFKELRE
jgi:hypothetical protein